jgi:putative DNA primase/helicase
MDQKESPDCCVSSSAAKSNLNDATGSTAGFGAQGVSPFDSEDSIALAFAQRYAGKLRFISSAKGLTQQRWQILDATGVWQVDRMLVVIDLVRELCREAAALCPDPALARELLSAATISAVERLARSDRRLAALPEISTKTKKRGAKA